MNKMLWYKNYIKAITMCKLTNGELCNSLMQFWHRNGRIIVTLWIMHCEKKTLYRLQWKMIYQGYKCDCFVTVTWENCWRWCCGCIRKAKQIPVWWDGITPLSQCGYVADNAPSCLHWRNGSFMQDMNRLKIVQVKAIQVKIVQVRSSACMSVYL